MLKDYGRDTGLTRLELALFKSEVAYLQTSLQRAAATTSSAQQREIMNWIATLNESALLLMMTRWSMQLCKQAAERDGVEVDYTQFKDHYPSKYLRELESPAQVTSFLAQLEPVLRNTLADILAEKWLFVLFENDQKTLKIDMAKDKGYVADPASLP